MDEAEENALEICEISEEDFDFRRTLIVLKDHSILDTGNTN